MNMRKRPLCRHFCLLLSDEERAHIDAQAVITGMTRSAFVRAAISGVHISTRADMRLARELSKLGGLCKHLYNNGAPVADTSAALRALEAAAKKLASTI